MWNVCFYIISASIEKFTIIWTRVLQLECNQDQDRYDILNREKGKDCIHLELGLLSAWITPLAPGQEVIILPECLSSLTSQRDPVKATPIVNILVLWWVPVSIQNTFVKNGGGLSSNMSSDVNFKSPRPKYARQNLATAQALGELILQNNTKV